MTLNIKALDENRRHRTRRADMFARSATDAGSLIHNGKALNEVNRLNRTLSYACSAIITVNSTHAKILFPNRVPHVNMRAHFLL